MTRRVQKRLYRFALYGRSGSGKTCLLTAMLMDRRPDPQGRTCKRLPVQEDDPPELHKGKKWLDDAVAALTAGGLPEPTRVDLDPPPRFRYEFTAAGRDVGYVELIDYSGELINPDDEAQPDALANRLKENFRHLDGILVLAEAPRRDGRSGNVSDELRRLGEAFASLGATAEEERLVPVALVLSKWDRQSALDGTAPAREYEHLGRFFAEHPTHQTLFTNLRHRVGDRDPPRAEADGEQRAEEKDGGHSVPPRPTAVCVEPDDTCNAGAFPVSAFGCSHVATHGRDVPDVTQPLPSFGLEAPFVWLMQRRDALDLHEIAQDLDALPGWWRPRLWFFNHPLLRRARRTRDRVPPLGEQAQQARQLYRRVARRLWGGTAIGVLLVLLALAISQGVWDGIQFAIHRDATADPSATDEELRRAESWLKAYLPQRFFHPVLSRFVTTNDAQELLQRIYAQRERRLYRPFQESTDVVVKQRLGEEYLRHFPNGTYADEARTFLEGRRQAREEGENEGWLCARETELQGAVALPSGDSRLQELDRLVKQCTERQGLPYPDAETDGQRGRRLRIQQTATDEKVEEMKHQEWQKFRLGVEKALADGRIAEAATLLAERQERDEPWQQLVRNLVAVAPAQTRTRLDKLIRMALWADGYKFINDCQEALGKLKARCPASLSGDLETLVRQGSQLRQATQEEHDQWLYQDVRRHRTLDKCNAYLKQAPLRTMRAEVDAYQRYLTAREGPLALTIGVKIRWGQGCETGNDNLAVVMLDNAKVIEAGSLVATPGATTGVIGQHAIKKRLTDEVKLDVGIVEDDSWLTFGDDDNGHGAASVPVGELKSYVLRLPNAAGTFFNEALFSLQGIPAEPNLPAAWRKSP